MVGRESWHEQILSWKKDFEFEFDRETKGFTLKPQLVLEEMNKQLAHVKHNVIITSGVGQHQMWIAQYFRWRFAFFLAKTLVILVAPSVASLSLIEVPAHIYHLRGSGDYGIRPSCGYWRSSGLPAQDGNRCGRGCLIFNDSD